MRTRAEILADHRNIADRTERELVETCLLVYSEDVRKCEEISKHIAEKLTQRRAIIRQRRSRDLVGKEPS